MNCMVVYLSLNALIHLMLIGRMLFKT